MSDYSTEVWRDVVGYEGLYQVSDLGRVKSIERTVPTPNGYNGQRYRTIREKILKFDKHRKRAYLTVALCSIGKVKVRYVHCLVLESFTGPCPDGMEACHYDDDPENNRLGNLRWGTKRSNKKDAARNGRIAHGEDIFLSKLTETDIWQIRSLYSVGYSYRELSDLFKVWPSTIGQIVKRKTWKHLP